MANAEAKEMENGERLAKVEQKVDNIEKVVTKIDYNFETFTSIYVPRTELNLMFNARDKELKEINDELNKKADEEQVKRIVKERDDSKKNLPAWLAVVMSAIAIIVTIILYLGAH